MFGAGNCPRTDSVAGEVCKGGKGNCQAEYLGAATDLLDLNFESVAAHWDDSRSPRADLLGDESAGIIEIYTDMGSLSSGEQTGERVLLRLVLYDPEEERGCFSDNSHNSHYQYGLGIQSVHLGGYVRIEGSLLSIASLSDLVADTGAKRNEELLGK